MPSPDGFSTPSFVYGTAWKEERTASLTEAAIRAGFRAIDTANQRRHYFEAGVGSGLEAVYRDGVVTRADLFLQTKFTYQSGQDHRLPYDPTARIATQVSQSMTSSLEHLGTDHVDSFVLHGPSSNYAWTEDDDEAWKAMIVEREKGRTRFIGVSNVSLIHLKQMRDAGCGVPDFVQNRCYARFGWDRGVRSYCREHNIVYQGFSLLTANVDVVRSPLVARIAERHAGTLAQVIFAFARGVGMLPLTGTTDVDHMKQDLASLDLQLAVEELSAIKATAG